MNDALKQFIEDFSADLVSGTAAYFIGAGISFDSDLPLWNELLKPYADRIGITDLENKDLPAIAQYVINDDKGNRGPFINSISNRLRRKYNPNSYHKHISRTNLKTVWTTNYDNLIETSLGDQQIDVKVGDDDFSRETPGAQIEIIKMHGCIYKSKGAEIVITQEDYEDFFIRRPATAQRLRADLLQKSFLFIGYGYQDPNIQNIISEARRMAKNSTRRHYLITTIPKKYTENEFNHWANNLRRFGILVITIKEYSQLNEILRELSLRSRGRSIFITGSHEGRNNDHINDIVDYMIENDLILNDGQSTGIMRDAVMVFMEKHIAKQNDIQKKLNIFPNPYAANVNFKNDLTLIPALKRWRIPLLKSTQIVIAFDGRDGTIAEVEKALELGCIVVPYFIDKTFPTFKLLEQPELSRCISQYDSNYVDKAKNERLEYRDLFRVLEGILNPPKA